MPTQEQSNQNTLLTQASALTICGRALEFLNDDTIVFRCANTIVFFSITHRSQRVLRMPPGSVLDSFALAPSVSRFATATRGTDKEGPTTRIRVYAFPGMEIVKEFTLDDVFPITHIAISRTASRLVTVSSLLNRHLQFWDISHPDIDAVERLAEYWWNTQGGLGKEKAHDGSSDSPHQSSNMNILHPPNGTLSSSADPDWSGYSPLLFISFHPRNHHEFTTGTKRSLVWWKLVSKYDTRLLVPLECGVYSSVTRKYLASPYATASTDTTSLEQFNAQFKVDEKAPTGSFALLSAQNDSEATFAYLRALGQTLSSSTVHQGQDLASVRVPESQPELTVSVVSKQARQHWQSSHTPGHGHAHGHGGHSHGHSVAGSPLAGSAPTSFRSSSSTASLGHNGQHQAGGSTATTEPNTERGGGGGDGQGSSLDEQRSFSSGNLLPLPSPTQGNLSSSASAPVLSVEEQKFDGSFLAGSLPGSGQSSHNNSTANLKQLVALPRLPSLASIPAGKPLSGLGLSVSPSSAAFAPAPPSSGPGVSTASGRKRSVFWGSSGGMGLGGSQGVGSISGFSSPMSGAAGFASRSQAREAQAAWEEDQRRLVALDAQEKGLKRTITSWSWSPEGQFLAGTSEGEVLVYTRGWTTSPSGSTQNAQTGNDTSSTGATLPAPAMHLAIHSIDLASTIPLLSLAVTRRFLLAGTSDGRVLWLDPSHSLSIHTSKFMSSGSPIVSLTFAPSFKHFAVLDAEGQVQLASTSSGPTEVKSPLTSPTGYASASGGGMATPSFAAAFGGQIQTPTQTRPSSGGSISNSTPLFAPARPPTGLKGEQESKDPHADQSTSAAATANQLRIHSFTLARFPLAVESTAGSSAVSSVAPLAHLVELLPRTNRLVLANQSTRELHVLHAKTKDFLASISFPAPPGMSHTTITSLASSPDGLLICVGFSTGCLALLDACPANGLAHSAAAVDEPLQLRVVFFEQVHLGAVRATKFSPGGSHLLSLGAQDQFMHFFRMRDFKLSGYMNLPSARVTGIDWVTVSGQNKVFVGFDDGALQIVTPPDPLYEPQGSLLLPDSILSVLNGTTIIACTTFVTDPGNERGFFALGLDRRLRRFQMEKVELMYASSSTTSGGDSSAGERQNTPGTPSTNSAGAQARKPLISAVSSDSWLGHQKVPNALGVSPDGEWIASGGRDGLVLLRRTADLGHSIVLAAHVSQPEFELEAAVGGGAVKSSTASSIPNGLTSLRFSSDSKLVLTSGVDGGVFVWELASLQQHQQSAAATSPKAGGGKPRAGAPGFGSGGPSTQGALSPPSVASTRVSTMAITVLKELPSIDLAFHPWPEGGVYRAHTNPQLDTSHVSGLTEGATTNGDAAAWSLGLPVSPAPTAASTGPQTFLDHQLSELLARNSFFHSEQAKLQSAIQAIRAKMQEMVYLNSRADPLEKITDPTEFIIDVELLGKLKRIMSSKVAATKQQIQLDNLAKELILERLKKQTWESMEVKGCIMSSLSPGASASGVGGVGVGSTTTSAEKEQPIEVSNFALRALSPKERATLRKVEFQRRMGVEEERWIAIQTHHHPPQHHSQQHHHQSHEDEERAGGRPGTTTSMGTRARGRFGEYASTRDANYILDNHNGVTRVDGDADGFDGSGPSSTGPTGLGSLGIDTKMASNVGEIKSSPTSPSAAGGIRAAVLHAEKIAAINKAAEAAKEKQLSVDRDKDADWNDEVETRTLWHPTMCFTNIRKRTQIHLLSLKIDRLKRKFNQAFQALFDSKVECVDLIVHKGVRIKEIQEELGGEYLGPSSTGAGTSNSTNVNTNIHYNYQPELSSDEIPERILTVLDSEIVVEKRLTPEEYLLKEKELAARKKDENDEANIRALQDMMYGTIESRKNDLNSLAKELEKPAWMTSISLDLMTDEQKQQIAEFERSEKALRLERETRQRLLETELKKLKMEVADMVRLFDHRLRNLFQQRLNVLKRIQKEEGTQLSLVNDLIENFEIATLQIESLFTHFQAELKNVRMNIQSVLSGIKRLIAQYTKRHESLLTEDKSFERNFRKEFQGILSGITLTNHTTGVQTLASDWVEYLFRLFKSRPTIQERERQTGVGGAGGGRSSAAAPLHPHHQANASVMQGGGVPGLNLSGLGTPGQVGSAQPQGSQTDRTGLAGTLNPLLSQAGVRKQRIVPGSGSNTARALGLGDARKASRIMRDLSGVVDTSDLTGGTLGVPGGETQPRPASQASNSAAIGAQEDDAASSTTRAFEALLPPTGSLSLRPPSPDGSKQRRAGEGGPTGPKGTLATGNLAYVLAKVRAQLASQSTAGADDPFLGLDSFSQDLDPDSGEFDYIPLDPADCPFELQLGDAEQEQEQQHQHNQQQEQEYDEEGNPIPMQQHQDTGSQSSRPVSASAQQQQSSSASGSSGGGSGNGGGIGEFRTISNVWGRLNERRAQKFLKEIELRSSHFLLADLHRIAQYLESQSEALTLSQRDLQTRKLAYDETRSQQVLNTEMILRLNQGLVEIRSEESPIVQDLIDCLMVDRSWVDQLNAHILSIANENVLVLKEMQKFRRGIRSKQWERSRLALLHSDAEDLTKELQLLRVTKNLQSLIKAGGQDNKSALEMNVMERKAEHIRVLTREEIDSRAKKLKYLKLKIRNSNAENERLGNSLIALNTLVEERRQIAKFNHDGEELRAAQDRRMVSIADRRHLLQLLENQKQLMATLHAERDKLRSKTYPSFSSLREKPPTMSLLPDHRDGLAARFYKPRPPAASGFGAQSPRNLTSNASSPRVGRVAAKNSE